MDGNPRIAFLGAGNMATALISGLVRAGTCAPERITASDVRGEALEALKAAHGIATADTNRAAVENADVVVLSVKPQVLPEVLAELAEGLPRAALVLSIAAGVPLSVIEGALVAGTRAVRAMPNTPALVGAGATGLAGGTHATDADLAMAEAVFASVGITVRVPETLLDAVTGLSGSGPAYVFRMVEAMTAGGIAAGLGADDAALLSAQTVYGAAKLLHESGEPPAELRRKVTSPGGTTAAGLATLEDRGFEATVVAAIESATARGRELGEAARKK